MASSGKLEVDVEIKSPAPKFWEAIRDSTTLFPKHFPDQYKSIDVLEGDGKAVGSVRLFTYAEGMHNPVSLIQILNVHLTCHVFLTEVVMLKMRLAQSIRGRRNIDNDRLTCSDIVSEVI